MSIFRNNVQGFIPEEDWLSVGFDVQRQGDPLEAIMGDDRTDNIVAAWQSIAAEYQVPVMAQFHSLDTESQKTFRVPVDNHSIEKGLIKVKLNQSESLRAATRAGVQGDEAIYEYVMDDGLRLADQVFTRSKVAKAEMLATGKVTIKENGIDTTVDYGVPTANMNKALDFGAGSTATIPEQLQELVDEAAANGVALSGMVLSRASLTKLRQDVNIQKDVNGNLGIGAMVRNRDFTDYMTEEYGIARIITDDLTYAVPDGYDANGRPKVKTMRYFPADRISFFAPNASGRIGTGLWGDPPEVDVERFFEGGVNAAAERPFVYISQWAERDPAVLWTKASALFMPVLYNPNALYVASVKETVGA
ncbi:MAG: major capsid protein [Clostridia bacterium]|nr:major capsid protein [Clostridia bacterium]